MKKTPMCWCLAAVACCLASRAVAGSFSPAIVTNDLNNPHKGFMMWGTDYAGGTPANHYGATIYHVYMPWREVEVADQVFDWGRFETNHLLPVLQDHPDATFVLRPVADYPDGAGSGITMFYTGGDTARDFPSFLTNAPLSIPFYPYTDCNGDGPGVTPDWNHPAIITQLVQFVEAFAQRYDGDSRITAVQVGLLGLWGEWHQSGCDARSPSNTVKAAVRDAYAGSFTNMPIQTRYPRVPDATGVDFGFHEDYFPSFTAPCIYGFPSCSDDGDWSLHYCFQNESPAATNNWRANPISGESPNLNQKRTWSNDFNDVMTVLRDYHFSFLGPAGGHQWNGNQARLNPMKRQLGYNFHVSRVDWPDTVHLNQPFQITLVLTNTGAAPCYHRFPVEVALCSTSGVPQWRGTFSFDLRELTPNLLFTKTESFTVTNVSLGMYSLRIGILDPRHGEPGVRIQSAGEDSLNRITIGNLELSDALTSDTDADGLPDTWEYQYFANNTNAVAGDDVDMDGMSNWEHYVSGTDPTNPWSFFRAELTGDADLKLIRFATITNRIYSVQRAETLAPIMWTNLAALLSGTGEVITVPDISAAPTAVYRAGVRLPH